MSTQTEHIERDVGFLFDPQARFVSLVKRGANQIPFRVVKNTKEESMKILQSIVARKGTDLEAIKSALGTEIADIAKLADPTEAGGFVTFEQVPREAFKADTFEVVPLSEDQSILGIQGESAEKQEGLIAKLFTPAKKSEVIAMAETAPVVSVEAMKSQLSNILWEEMDALWQSIHGILSQDAGSGSEKVAMVKTIFGNFLESLDTAMVSLKCDSLEPKQEAVAKSQEESAPVAEPEVVADAAAEPAQVSQGQPTEQPAVMEQGSLLELETLKAVDAMKAQLAETLKPLTDDLASIREEVAKLQKAPAAVVADRTDDGIASVKKSQQPENVFAGVFGSLR